MISLQFLLNFNILNKLVEREKETRLVQRLVAIGCVLVNIVIQLTPSIRD